MSQKRTRKAKATIRITRFRKTRYWAIWEGDELLTVTVYLKGARSILTKIKTMKTTTHKPGLIVPATDRDGAKVRLMVTAKDKTVTYISHSLKGEFAIDDSIEQPLPELLDEGLFTLITSKGEKELAKFFAEKKKAKEKKSPKAKKSKKVEAEDKTEEPIAPWLEEAPQEQLSDEAIEAELWQQVEEDREQAAQREVCEPEEAPALAAEETEPEPTQYGHALESGTTPKKAKAMQVILPGQTEPQDIPADFVMTPGAKLIRIYKGRTIEVLMQDYKQFVWEGKVYPTLTHISWEAAGYQIAGSTFFGIPSKRK